MAAPLGLEPEDIAAALAALEAEGFALRGRFTPAADAGRMVRAPAARPHSSLYGQAAARRDRAGRRARLPALPPRLAAGHGRRAHGRAGRGRDHRRAARRVSRRRPAPGRPRSCRRASPATSRPGSTIIAWPDASLGRACGRATARPDGSERGAAPVRTTPITLLARRHAPLWASLSPPADVRSTQCSGASGRDCIREHGASFFDELVDGTGLLRPQVEEALAELVASAW